MTNQVFEATAYYDGVGIKVDKCELVLIERSLINTPERAGGHWPENVATHPYTENFDQREYIAAFWSSSVNNYILIEM